MNNFPYHDLWLTVSQFLRNASDSSDIEDFRLSVRERKADLLNCGNAPIQNPNPTDRQKIQTGSVTLESLNQTIQISEAIQKGILELSDSLQLNELRVLELWVTVSQPTERRWLESQVEVPAGSLEDDLPGAVRALHFYEAGCLIRVLGELLKGRMDPHLLPSKKEVLMAETNALLRDGLPSKLMARATQLLAASQTQGHQVASFSSALIPAGVSAGAPALGGLTAAANLPTGVAGAGQHQSVLAEMQTRTHQDMEQVAECLFYLYYQTQITGEEAVELVMLIEAYSKVFHGIVTQENKQPTSLSTFGRERLSSSTNGVGPQAAAVFRSLSTLVMAVACALDQTHELLDRVTQSVNSFGVGNALEPPGSSQQATSQIRKLQDTILNKAWDHQGTHGIVLLIWALFKKPALKGNTFPISDMDTILQRVLKCGAFSFLTSPFLTTRWLIHRELIQPFIFGVCEEMVCGYMELVCGDMELAQVAFPPSRVIWLQDLAADARVRGQQPVQPQPQDCLDDVLRLIAVICKMQPSLAENFWSSNENQASKLFLQTVLERSQVDNSIFVPTLGVLEASCLEPGTAFQVYNFLRRGGLMSWDHFFNCIKGYSQNLLMADPEQVRTQGTRLLREEDVQGLTAIMRLIQRVAADPEARVSLAANNQWDPLPSLAALLTCGVPPSLKGAILKAFASFCKSSALCQQIWELLEAIQILPTTSRQKQLTATIMPSTRMEHQSAKPASGAGAATFGGIKYELENVESLEREYPTTEGFACLIQELVSNYFPAHGYIACTVPLMPYLDFLFTSVLMKADAREYKTEQQGEKWRIVSRILQIFLQIIRRYGIPEEISNDFDTRNQKSPGFILIRHLLGGGLLMQKILSIVSGSSGGMKALQHLQQDGTAGEALIFQAAAGWNELANPALPQPSPSDNEMEDWVWWRERACLLSLGILSTVAQKETEFLQRYRSSDCATSAANLTIGAAFGSLDQHTGNLAPLAAHIVDPQSRSLAAIAFYVQHSGCAVLPLLSCTLLGYLSQRLPPHHLLAGLVDKAHERALVGAYVLRLKRGGFEACESGLGPRTGVDSDFMTLDQDLFGIDLNQSQNFNDMMEMVDTPDDTPVLLSHWVRQRILELFLTNLDLPAPNLAHVLLGLKEYCQGAVASRPLPMSLRAVAVSDGNPSNCLEAVLDLLQSGVILTEDLELAEKCFELVYRLCALPTTSKPVMELLRVKEINFFHTQLRKLLPLMATPGASATVMAQRKQSMAWLLKGIALELHTTATGESPNPTKTRQLLSLLFGTEVSGQPGFLCPMLELLESVGLMQSEFQMDVGAHATAMMEECTEPLPGPQEISSKFYSVNLNTLHELLTASYAVGGGGNQPKQMNDDEVRKVLYAAAAWNEHVNTAASLAYICEAWRKVLEVSLTSCSELLLGNTHSAGDKGTATVGTASGMGGTRILSDILALLLTKLADNPGADMTLAEPLAACALCVFGAFRRLGCTQAPISPGEGRVYLNQLLGIVMRRGTGSSTVQKHSKAFRGTMYACILHFFNHTQGNLARTTSSATPLPAAGAPDRALVMSPQDICAEHQLQNLIILDQNCEPFVEVLGRDGCCGPTLPQTLALSVLSAAFTLLSKSSTERFSNSDETSIPAAKGSYAFITALNTLVKNGYLKQQMELVLPPNETDMQTDRPSEAVLGAVLTLFTEISSIPTGAKTLLMDYNIMRVLMESDYLYSSSSMPDLSKGTMELDSHAYAKLPTLLIPALRLIQSLVICLPGHHEACAQVCDWVVRRYKSGSLSALLKMRVRNLEGLRALALLTGIVAHCVQMPQVFNERMDRYNSKLVASLWRVLGTFGPQQIPAALGAQQSFRGSSRSQRSEGSWWDVINPVGSHEKKRQEMRCSPPSGFVSHDWNLFESDKLEVSQIILRNTIYFLRTRIEYSAEMLADPDITVETLKKAIQLFSMCLKASGSIISGSEENVQTSTEANAQVFVPGCQLLNSDLITEQIEGLLVILKTSTSRDTSLTAPSSMNLVSCVESIQKTALNKKLVTKLCRCILNRLHV